MVLNIDTPYGDHYKVDSNGNIIRMDMPDFKPSGEWRMLGITHVKRNYTIPLNCITPQLLKGLILLWKNGKPQWTILDYDHGTKRVWGNTKYHGIKRLYFTEE